MYFFQLGPTSRNFYFIMMSLNFGATNRLAQHSHNPVTAPTKEIKPLTHEPWGDTSYSQQVGEAETCAPCPVWTYTQVCREPAFPAVTLSLGNVPTKHAWELLQRGVASNSKHQRAREIPRVAGYCALSPNVGILHRSGSFFFFYLLRKHLKYIFFFTCVSS